MKTVPPVFEVMPLYTMMSNDSNDHFISESPMQKRHKVSGSAQSEAWISSTREYNLRKVFRRLTQKVVHEETGAIGSEV